MTVQRDPDAIIAAWLDDGPTGFPSRHAASDRGRPPEPPIKRGVAGGRRGGLRP